MAVDYTTDGLIASVKRRVLLPDAQNLYTDEDLVLFLGDELSSTLVPLIHSVAQEYWIYRHDVPLVQNQANYTIPVRGIVNGLRLVTLVDPNNQNEIQFPLLRPEDTASTYNWLSPYSTSTLYGFYMEDDHIVMFPQQLVTNPTQSVRFRFERQPNQLCSTTDAGKILAINGTTVTLSFIPTDWIVNTTLLDLTKGSIAFTALADDLTISNINTGTLQVTIPDLPSTAAVGDWLSDAGTAPVAQIPYQAYPLLAQSVAVKVLEGMDDDAAYQKAVSAQTKMEAQLLKALQPRDMGNTQVIVNRGGLFDAGQFWGWGSGSGNFW